MAKLEEELREEIYKTEKLLKNVNKELKKVDKCHEKVKVSFKGNSMQAYINESDGKKNT
ncbi:hypothetical protein SAMN02910289_01865 [Lachnospiraceae bacterium RM5]|nr:hypothetical protein SAMN02910289_01865 [Lachnospiraceae bacterium RM5]